MLVLLRNSHSQLLNLFLKLDLSRLNVRVLVLEALNLFFLNLHVILLLLGQFVGRVNRTCLLTLILDHLRVEFVDGLAQIRIDLLLLSEILLEGRNALFRLFEVSLIRSHSKFVLQSLHLSSQIFVLSLNAFFFLGGCVSFSLQFPKVVVLLVHLALNALESG